MKNKIYNIAIIVLCLVAIYINLRLEEYRAIGAGCLLFMGILALAKGEETTCFFSIMS